MNDLTVSQTSRLEEIKTELRECAKRTSREVVVMGLRLQEARDILRGGFERWVEDELGISVRLARNCIYVADRFGQQIGNIAGLPPTVLYNLAAPSTPNKVIDEVISRVKDGEILKVKDVTAIIDRTKPHRRTADEALTQATDNVIGEVQASGAVSVGGESLPATPVTIKAALGEQAAELIRTDNEVIARKLDQEDGVESAERLAGKCVVDHVNPDGRVTLFSPALAAQLEARMRLQYVLYILDDPYNKPLSLVNLAAGRTS